MEFLEFAKARYSCRKFSDKQVEPEKIEKIIETANAAPTATNAQPFRLWVLCSEEAVKKVNETTRFGFGAQTVIVVGGKLDEAWVRKSDGRNFADVDASIVGTHIMLEVQALGLGTTWVGVIDVPKLKQLFPEMEDYDIVGLFPIGYPAADEGGQPSKMHTQRKAKESIAEIL